MLPGLEHHALTRRVFQSLISVLVFMTIKPELVKNTCRQRLLGTQNTRPHRQIEIRQVM
jgi:hypothetical protein